MPMRRQQARWPCRSGSRKPAVRAGGRPCRGDQASLSCRVPSRDLTNIAANKVHACDGGRPVLGWIHRVHIALDAARGLEYLHETVRPAVTHKDVRSTNVLLFEGFRAKIADYNMFSQAADMARLNRSTHTLGSFGYQAPEYAMTGQMTDKSDVYSFGIVLLELLTGRKPLDRTLPQGQRSLVNWATPMLTEDRVQECIDPKLGDQYPPAGALKLGRIAVQCLMYDPISRPSMGTVARVINYAVLRDQQGVV